MDGPNVEGLVAVLVLVRLTAVAAAAAIFPGVEEEEGVVGKEIIIPSGNATSKSGREKMMDLPL